MLLLLTFKDIADNILLFIGAVTGIIGFCITLWKCKGWIKETFKIYKENRKQRLAVPALIASINSQVNAMTTRLAQVETDIKDPNSGTTVKGLLKLIKAELDVANWLSPRPAFRTTSNGINVSVNEAYCHLCGVTSDELMRLGWKNFVADVEQGDDFFARWLMASKELSQFSGRLKIQAKNGDLRGEWTFRIRPLGPIESDKDVPNYLWSGGLYPYDETAKTYARQYNIPLFG